MRRLLAAAILLTLAAGASAQELERRREDELKERQRIEREVLEAAERAKKTAQAEPFEPVTYEEVMKDPDNIGLNFRYARTQVAKGDLLKAAATLERILMVDPELPRVRLFYASVLLRLDNLDDAERELRILTKQTLTDSMREELEGYLIQIKRRRRKTRVGLTVAAGFDFDENRNSAPSSGKRLALDVPVTLDTNSTRRNDTSATMNAAVNVHHDLGYQAGHSLSGSMSYYRAEQFHIKTLNIQSYNGSIGGTFRSPFVDVTPSMSAGHLLLAQTTYQRSHGPSLRLDKRLGQRFAVFGTAGYQRQEYSRTQVVPTANERNGSQHSGGVGFSLALPRAMSLSAAYTRTMQGAIKAFNAYRRDGMNISVVKGFARGRFAVLSLTPQLDTYADADRTISAKTRQDHTYRANLTAGTPLGFLASPLNSLLLTLSYEYFHARSNIPNNAYTNNKVSSTLTYRLDL